MPADWKPHEENVLLAWLDYSLLKADGFRYFKESVSAHLSKECNTSYSYEQCRAKLYRFWNYLGDDDSAKVADLYKQGSDCLGYLPPERKKLISEKVADLNGRDIDSPRRLRSTSRISEITLQSHVDEHWAASAKKGKIHYRRPSKLPVPSVVIPSNPGTAHHDDQPGKRRRLSNLKYRTLPQDHESKTGYTLSTSEGSSVASDEIASDDDQTPIPRTKNHNEGRASNCRLKAELENLRTEFEALKERVELMNDIHRSLTVSLYSSLLQAEGRHREDETRINCLKNTDNSLPYRQLEYQAKKIATLQEKLDKARHLRRFTQLASTEEIRSWTGENVRQEMSSMGYLAKQLLYGHDNVDNFDPPDIDNHKDLRALVQKGLGVSSEAQVSADTVLGLLASFSLQAIVRSLTFAAICEWVFEADIHEMIFTESVLLEEYKAHLRMRDGETSLRNLDFAAHHSLLNGELFQKHIIPQRAESLAHRFLKTLSPFFVNEKGKERVQDRSCQDSSLDYFSTWGVEQQIWEPRRQKLIKIFWTALKLKCQFITSNDQFEAVFYSSQTPFDPSRMIPETMQGSVIRTADVASQAIYVKLCLLPSLYVLKHDCAQVIQKNFVRRLASERQESERLTEALVVVTTP